MKPIGLASWSHFVGVIDATLGTSRDVIAIHSHPEFMFGQLFTHCRSVLVNPRSNFLSESDQSQQEHLALVDSFKGGLQLASQYSPNASIILDLTTQCISTDRFLGISGCSRVNLQELFRLCIVHKGSVGFPVAVGELSEALVNVEHPIGKQVACPNIGIMVTPEVLENLFVLQLTNWGTVVGNHTSASSQKAKSVGLVALLKPPKPKLRALKYSVLMPVYNHHQVLPQAIESIERSAAFTDNLIEIVVVDDGSQTRPEKISSKLPVTYIRSPTNKGVSNALNVAKNAASGDFMCWLSADDLFLNGFFGLRDLLLAFQPNANVIFSAPNTLLLHRSNQIVCPSISASSYSRESIIAGSIYGVGVNGITMTIDAKLLDDFDFSEQFRHAQDIKLWYELAMYSDAVFRTLPLPTTLSRLAENTVSSKFNIICELEGLLSVLYANQLSARRPCSADTNKLAQIISELVCILATGRDPLHQLRIVALASVIKVLGIRFSDEIRNVVRERSTGINRLYYENIFPLLARIESLVKKDDLITTAHTIAFDCVSTALPDVRDRWELVTNTLLK